MAVQKRKSTRSRRGMRRSHDSLNEPNISIDKISKEKHLRYNLTSKGYYKGIKILKKQNIKKKKTK
ncbi:50S ribosomal protein L32 [Candidatus Purcelliella pentastirinorum]|uniref:50S ribosomal protein L32 n=1 Tax=Candidatus Purcelliella pentastirinorum TaxID=472834 RepID=UPI00237B7624|nr:50S ribosomal protein L32 [Candidatus Purcelliella pentastirinorum]WDR80344.1 50S ribosomal protein L32 [Candidatus Purcelliella pentastirinorum]